MHKHNAISQSAQHLFFRCRLWLKADRWRLSLFISQTLFILVFLAANWRFATMTLINWDNRAESGQEVGNFITTRKCKWGAEQENTFVWEIRPKELPTNNSVLIAEQAPHVGTATLDAYEFRCHLSNTAASFTLRLHLNNWNSKT